MSTYKTVIKSLLEDMHRYCSLSYEFGSNPLPVMRRKFSDFDWARLPYDTCDKLREALEKVDEYHIVLYHHDPAKKDFLVVGKRKDGPPTKFFFSTDGLETAGSVRFEDQVAELTARDFEIVGFLEKFSKVSPE